MTIEVSFGTLSVGRLGPSRPNSADLILGGESNKEDRSIIVHHIVVIIVAGDRGVGADPFVYRFT